MRRHLSLVGVALLLSGCGVMRDGAISPSVNDCVAALPVAQTLLGPHARLLRLRRYAFPEVQQLLRRLGAPVISPSDATPAERASLAAERARAALQPGGSPSTAADPHANGPRPCVLVFGGAFEPATLRAAPGHPVASAVSGPTTGDYALVVTTTRHPRVVRVAVSTHEPADRT